MLRRYQSVIKVSALLITGLFSNLLFSTITSAQPQPHKGTDGNYIGAGLSVGVTEGGQTSDAPALGGNIQGRYDIKNSPISLRGSAIFTDENLAIIPSVSYDVALAKNVNGYLGVGYSVITNEAKTSPIGNQDSLILSMGGEAQVSNHVMVYGDAKWGINAYQNSPADAVSLQMGLGYKF